MSGKISRVLVLLLLASLITACTQEQENSITDQPGLSATPVVDSHNAPVRVAVIPPGFTSPFHVAIRTSTTEAGAQLGWQVDVVAPEQEDDFAGQATVMEQEIEKQVQAISVNPIDSNAITAPVKRANQAKVPVFMHNQITPIEKGEVAEYIGYDQWNGAAALGKYACTLLQGHGEVFILTGLPGFHSRRRTEGFKAALAQYCPAVQVVGEQNAQWEREAAINIATVALQQHPDIKLFYGNSDEMDIGACIAAKKLGRKINKDLFCLGIDGNPVTLEAIKKGDITATLGTYPAKMGETLIAQMNKYLHHEQIPPNLPDAYCGSRRQ